MCRDLVLSKQNSEPTKQLTNILQAKVEKGNLILIYTEDNKIDHLLESDVNNDVAGASSTMNGNHKDDVEAFMMKIRSEYTRETLLKCPYTSKPQSDPCVATIPESPRFDDGNSDVDS